MSVQENVVELLEKKIKAVEMFSLIDASDEKLSTHEYDQESKMYSHYNTMQLIEEKKQLQALLLVEKRKWRGESQKVAVMHQGECAMAKFASLSTETIENFIEELRELPDRCVYERAVISEKAMNVKLRNRQSTIDILQSVINIETNLSGSERSDKLYHQIPVLSTLSGFGKTRILLELKQLVCQKHMWRYEYITYGQAYSESSRERGYDAAIMLAWRLIYFYFSPNESWDCFLDKLEAKRIVNSLTVESALSKISSDASSIPGEKPVYVIAIDEFQVLSPQSEGSCKGGGRLVDVIRALSSLMCREMLPFIVVPIFAGLYLKPFGDAAKILSVKPRPILLEPLSYEDASAILTEYSGDPHIMRTPIVQDLVWQFSAMPAYLLDLYNQHKHHDNWENSYSVVRSLRMLKQTSFLDESRLHALLKIIACSITKTSVNAEICSGEYLDGCGACWYVDRVKNLVDVSYSLMNALSSQVYQNSHRNRPVDTFLLGFKESFAAVCHECGFNRATGWKSMESIGVAYLALRINSYGLLFCDVCDSVDLKDILHGAVFARYPGKILVRLSPVTPTEISRIISPSCMWGEKHFVGKTHPHQPCIDAVSFFPNCVYKGDDMDLFVFDQRKYRPESGLVPAVYRDAVDWCRKYVAQYSEQNSNRRTGFIFGVINPLKEVSLQLRKEMDNLCHPSALEFYFAMGRDECAVHYTVLKDHPALTPRVYINSDTLTSEMLAVALDEWTYPVERAAAILKKRPESGFTAWEQVVAAAHLERDGDNIIDLPAIPAIIIV